MWKFCGKAQFSHSFGRFAWNYAETVPFRKLSTPGNQVKWWYFSQWFEKLLQKRLLVFFDNILLKIRYGFRKRAWRAKLLNDDAWILEKYHWQKQSTWSIANRPVKSIGCLDHNLLITKPWVPKGLILGPLLFSTFMCDMFLILKTIIYWLCRL